jgi:TolB protein
MDSDGKNIKCLTPEMAWCESPTWSPDGAKIAFERERNIYVISADGTDRRAVSPVQHTTKSISGFQICPSWFPESQRIAFIDSHSLWEIYSINIDGSDAIRHDIHIGTNYGIGFIGVLCRLPATLAVSPDGASLAFGYCDKFGRNDIYILSLVDGKLVNLTRNLAGNSFSPAWSPDGTRIALTLETEGKTDIYLIDTDGSNPTLLVEDGAFPAWQR